MVYRIYVEKKPGFDGEAQGLKHELVELVGIKGLKALRLLNRYDVEGIDRDLFEKAIPTVFSEPPVDVTYTELPTAKTVFAVEYLPGQFDQRADSASECIQLLSQGERPSVRSARIYLLDGELSAEDLEAIKKYVINPVEAREASLDTRDTLKMEFAVPTAVETLNGFCALDDAALENFRNEKGLAMDHADIVFCQNYFKSEQRDPTITEIRLIDTYWSDHCRHTTFGTILNDVKIDDEVVQAAFDRYMALRAETGRDKKNRTLMDLATIGAKALKQRGILQNLDESEEINACTVKIKCDVDGELQDWLFLFKNETHNHPTEIEPFGGAATCIGGAIRDPLSGRSYVYQAMRVTGAGDPLKPVAETMPGKLPQRKLVTTAAAGYSSYGNQIGLATGQVAELYHPGYVAKRMEIGAVVGATPASHVRREEPQPGDVIILLGGRTGRDGIGGATGSSKAHKLTSLETCGAEVQKGNAPIERKLQRLFRREDACCMIKRCNDFGAGGVSVAIGELADGLNIDLNKVTKKYEGLDGTELAISESQERMAVAVAAEDAEKFIALANEENLEATVVATVTEEKRMRENWNGVAIVDLSREFLNSNGAERHADVHVLPGTVWQPQWAGSTFAEKLENLVGDLNVCSQKGLGERFDSTIGASTVLMPYGGKYQLTPTMAMAAKLPVDGETTTCSGMAWGFNPYLTEADPYRGAYMAVVESVTKLVCAGFRHKDMYLTFQEYFEHLNTAPERWGKPLAALLGALDAQMGLGIASIGGKDSMSGSFYDEEHGEIDVPPTLVSFAVDISDTKHVVSPEFKKAGSKIVLFTIEKDAHDLPVYSQIMDGYEKIYRDMESGKIISAYAVEGAGVAEAVSKMAFGNRLGVKIEHNVDPRDFFAAGWGNIVCEVPDGKVGELSIPYTVIGEVTDKGTFEYGSTMISMEEALKAWTGTLEKVFPTASGAPMKAAEETLYNTDKVYVCKHKVAKPTVFIPAMPGTNCELDSAKAFEAAGAETIVRVFRNQNASDIRSSIEQYKEDIKKSQIIMFPGGFSAGDEPDGSAKFFATVFRNEAMMEEIDKLLHDRDGLVLGICNGFQTLIKLGLLTGGKIEPQKADSPTLTTNNIGRHISRMAYLKVVSNLSPWLRKAELGGVYCNPMSHGEGRFVANEEWLAKLRANGQIAIQYSDPNGNLSVSEEWNPNGSYQCIEGITSPDGRILGKMGHNERCWSDTGMNIYGNQDMQLFASGVEYFK